VAFLEETFSAHSANPRYRLHEQAARTVLEALLPGVSSDMKGRIRSYPELLDISGYGKKPRAFKELMRILDGETRLITPADPQVVGDETATSRPAHRYYQLTHDYLVTSLRQWLTKKHRSTRAGRSELRLASRSAMWMAHPERRQLPSLWEWVSIRLLTRSDLWSETQRRMMRTAARHHALSIVLGTVLLVAILLAGPEFGRYGRDLLMQVRARNAGIWMALGYDQAVWPLLKAAADPTLRTSVVHELSPLGIDLEGILARLDRQDDVSIRRAMLVVAKRLIATPRERLDAWANRQPTPLSPAATKQLLDLYHNDPDPGIHATAEWTLRACGQSDQVIRAAQPSVVAGTRGERQWYITSQGHTMVIIPGPTQFLMGATGDAEAAQPDEQPHHRRIRRSFSIASRETTVEQFHAFLTDNAWAKQNMADQPAPAIDLPQGNITWYEAAAYCNWLSKAENLPPDEWCYLPNERGQYAAGMRVAVDYLDRRGYRLPTEAEWEYACRAGATTAYSFGSDPAYLRYYAQSGGRPRTVGEGEPNEFGLFDMHGNVAEWCQDRYARYLANDNGASRGKADRDSLITDSDARVRRGGAFNDPAALLRCAARDKRAPGHRSESSGFRVARSYP